MKKIIFTSLLILSSASCWSQSFFNDIKVSARAGYNVGGTQPVGLPASIRKLHSYTVHMITYLGKQITQIFNKEIIILEYAKNAKIK